MKKILTSPIIFLLVINFSAGLLTFRDYGMSWDEPLFYNYADSIRTAYSPEIFSPNFDFEKVYGKSAEDHKIYGPAYLLLAHPIQDAAQILLQTDMADAWHLVNFLTFQAGLIAFYFLGRKLFEPWPAAAATALMAWQPVYWGHSFINPKDIPFMVIFMIAMLTGFNFIDRFKFSDKQTWMYLLIAAISLGLASAIRVIGPLAGVLVIIYGGLQKKWGLLLYLAIYGSLSIAVMYFFWPYLWADPINRLMEVFKHMSNNPTELAVLFDGQLFHANEMPRRYIPQIMLLTLTEPTLILFFSGIVIALYRVIRSKKDWKLPVVMMSLFIFMLSYLLYKKPSVYDGFRHFFFITPPIFLFSGFVFQWMREKYRSIHWHTFSWLLLLPGLIGIVQLHPYEYTFYNLYAGGLQGAFRTYETDYWLTCYREAIQWSELNFPGRIIHVQREFSLAEYYNTNMIMKDLGEENEKDILPGDLMLFHSRSSLDVRSIFRKLPVLHTISRNNADFCLIKQK